MDLDLYVPSSRYAGRADQYRRFRPTYPLATVEVFRREAGPEARFVADVGSGTGLFSQRLLEAGFSVQAVEPNEDMRAEAEARLAWHAGFVSIKGTAEATTLRATSIDAVSCAQAFHWFDVSRVVPEFRRILKPGGLVCLLWNNQRFDADAFHRDYEEVLRRGCPDYERFNISSIAYSARKLEDQFSTDAVSEYHFDNEQVLDLEGLKGRISSVSYCPPLGTTAYQKLMAETEALFGRHQSNGSVRILHDLEMYCIRFAPDSHA